MIDDINLGSIDASIAKATANAAASQKASEALAPTVVGDLNSGNYAGAFSAAESLNSQYGTNQNQATSNPLLEMLETSQGLETLDPSKKWTDSSIDAYYQAAMSATNWNANDLGHDPYGATLWGSNATGKAAADALTNESTVGDDSAPDLGRFAGAQPTKNFVEKYGADIALVVAAVAAPYAVPALAAVAVGADASATALAAAEVGAGAAYGAGTNAAIAGATGGNAGKAAELGAIGGAVGGAELGGSSGAVGSAETALSSSTGLSQGASDIAVQGSLGAAAGAASGKVSGTGALKGAELGAVGGVIAGGVQASGLTGTSATVANKVGTGLADSALTSSSSSASKPTNSLSTGVAPLGAAGASMADSDNTAVAPTTFTSGLTQGLSSSLGLGSGNTSLLGSLGTLTGQVAPYAAIGAIGQSQAAAGQKEDAAFSAQQQALAQPSLNESNQLLSNYQSGTLSAAQQNVVNTGEAQGQSLINSAASLSTIAQTAFSNYNSGTLKAADQTQLDQQVAAQKQQVAQQLASAGITDSTILAAQNQQIDNNALITKQNILNSYFSTGNTAYDSWLSSTTQGQQTIMQAQQYASTALEQTLNDSMSEANIGINEMNTALNTQMATDQKYADQVSTLYGTLAQAYAKQYAVGNSSGGSGGSGSNLLGSAAGAQTPLNSFGSAATGGSGGLSTLTGSDTTSTADAGLATSGDIDPTLQGDIAGETIPATADLGGQITDEATGDLGGESDDLFEDDLSDLAI